MQQMTTHAEGIQSALVGAFYYRFAVSDGFDFYFDSFVLSSREVLFSDEAVLNAQFLQSYAPARFTANPDYIAKSAIAAACIGILVSSVEILPDSSLQLTFDNNVILRLPTDTSVVDWHWAITKSGGNPYEGCLVGCFAPGDIQGDMPNNSLEPRPLRGAPQLRR
jgi:hypothetical protein